MAFSKDVKFRPLKTILYPGVAGQTRDSLPVTEVYQSLNVRLTGVATPTVGVTGVPEDVLSFIRGITIEGTSNNRRAAYGKFKQAEFAAMYTLQRFLRNIAGAVVPYAPGLVGPGAVPTPFAADLQLDFEFPHSSDPRRTWLNAAKDLQTLSIIIDWGDITDIDDLNTDAAEAGAIVAQVVVSGRELVDPDIKKYDFGVNTFTAQDKATAGAAAPDFWFDLRRGNLLRGMLIKAYTTTGYAFHTPTDALINGITFRLNRENKVEFFDWPTLQGQNLIDYRMPALIPGYAFIDFMEDGNYNKIVNTQAYTDVILTFNVNAVPNARIRVYPVEIFPGRII